MSSGESGSKNAGGNPTGRPSWTDLLVGAAVGMLFGILVGLSRSPVVGEVTAALGALLVAFFGLQTEKSKAIATGNPSRLGAFCVTFTVVALAGVWARAHDRLAPTPAERLHAWTAAGFSKEDGRAIVAAQLTGAKFEVLAPSLREQYDELISVGFEPDAARALVATRLSANKEPPQGAASGEAEKPEPLSVFFTEKSQRDFCGELKQEGPNPEEELRKYEAKGGGWKTLAERIKKTHKTPDERAAAVTTTRALLCGGS